MVAARTKEANHLKFAIASTSADLAEGTLGAWLYMVLMDSGSISEREDEFQRADQGAL
jgi:hypothetical protein